MVTENGVGVGVEVGEGEAVGAAVYSFT